MTSLWRSFFVKRNDSSEKDYIKTINDLSLSYDHLMCKFKNLFILVFTIAWISTSSATIYPFVTGNRLNLIEDPTSSAELKLELVRKAQHHVHIITFYWDDSDFARQMADELIKAHERGVEVRILTTYFPSLATDLRGVGRRRLKDYEPQKGSVFSFIPLKSYDNLVFFNILHEKLFIVDGKIAILGGRNISDSRFKNKDMDLSIEGEAVNQVQQHFHKTYEFVVDLIQGHKCTRPRSRKCQRTTHLLQPTRFLPTIEYFPEQPQYENGVRARILTHEVLIDQVEYDYQGMQERVHIQDDIIDVVESIPFDRLRGYNYFFIPTPKYQSILEERLAQGKQIEIVTNSFKSSSHMSPTGYVFSLPSMLELSQKGLQFIEWQGPSPDHYLHSKIMIFDQDRVILGAHNFGIGSTSVSNEIAIDFISTDIATRLIQIFEEDQRNPEIAKPVSTEFLDEMKERHKVRIRVLKFAPIQYILQQLY